MSHELIRVIQNAFKGVRLEDGISLNMTEYYDSGGSQAHYKDLSNNDERDDWSKISDKTLEDYHVTFSFTDIKGFRFYAPAYMIWSVKHLKDSQSIIGDFTIYALDPDHYVLKSVGIINVFNQPQINAIIDFLKFSEANDDYCDGRLAAINLEKIKIAQQGKES